MNNRKIERDIFMMLASDTDPKAIFTWIKNHKQLTTAQKVEMIKYTINESDHLTEFWSRIHWLV